MSLVGTVSETTCVLLLIFHVQCYLCSFEKRRSDVVWQVRLGVVACQQNPQNKAKFDRSIN